MIFIAIYIYGWKHLPPWLHFWAGVPIVIAGIGGTASVIAAGAWMNQPGGFTVDRTGNVVDVDPLGVIFNDSRSRCRVRRRPRRRRSASGCSPGSSCGSRSCASCPSNPAGYRDYVEQRYLDGFDRWAASIEGQPDAGTRNPKLPDESQWDSDLRLAHLDAQGVAPEVLFPNGLPFVNVQFQDAVGADDPELAREGRRAYNRWLADFCAEAPGRRAGQAVVVFDDLDEAVADVHWAKEHGLMGVMMPALEPGGTYFLLRRAPRPGLGRDRRRRADRVAARGQLAVP